MAQRQAICAAADSNEMIDLNKDVTLRIAAADGRGGPLPDAQVDIRNILARPATFDGRTRLDVVMSRGAIQPGISRFVAEVSWRTAAGWGRREIVVILRS
jgi:hypothetical protein